MHVYGLHASANLTQKLSLCPRFRKYITPLRWPNHEFYQLEFVDPQALLRTDKLGQYIDIF